MRGASGAKAVAPPRAPARRAVGKADDARASRPMNTISAPSDARTPSDREVRPPADGAGRSTARTSPSTGARAAAMKASPRAAPKASESAVVVPKRTGGSEPSAPSPPLSIHGNTPSACVIRGTRRENRPKDEVAEEALVAPARPMLWTAKASAATATPREPPSTSAMMPQTRAGATLSELLLAPSVGV
jgi:hypothetical protein